MTIEQYNLAVSPIQEFYLQKFQAGASHGIQFEVNFSRKVSIENRLSQFEKQIDAFRIGFKKVGNQWEKVLFARDSQVASGYLGGMASDYDAESQLMTWTCHPAVMDISSLLVLAQAAIEGRDLNCKVQCHQADAWLASLKSDREWEVIREFFSMDALPPGFTCPRIKAISEKNQDTVLERSLPLDQSARFFANLESLAKGALAAAMSIVDAMYPGRKVPIFMGSSYRCLSDLEGCIGSFDVQVPVSRMLHVEEGSETFTDIESQMVEEAWAGSDRRTAHYDPMWNGEYYESTATILYPQSIRVFDAEDFPSLKRVLGLPLLENEITLIRCADRIELKMTGRNLGAAAESLQDEILDGFLRNLTGDSSFTSKRPELAAQKAPKPGHIMQNKDIATMFDELAHKMPMNTAVLHEGESLTYNGLREKSTRAAGWLWAYGVRPGMVIALETPTSFSLITGMLAILRCGATVLAIDPETPSGRKKEMCHLANAIFYLGAEDISSPGIGFLSVNDALNSNVPFYGTEIDHQSGAYVLFTSGTTGQPKGCLVSHSALIHRINWGQDLYPLTESDCVAQLASINFDFAYWEIFAPLLQGGSLLLLNRATILSPSLVCREIQKWNVTVIHLFPSLLQIYSELTEFGRLTCLKYVFIGGELLRADMVQNASKRLPDTMFYNQYGPAETTIDVTAWPFSDKDRFESYVPIGFAAAGIDIQIRDERGNEVPLGVAGEMYIGGSCLSHGYISDPRRTAEQFVPDFRSGSSGGRLYKTGDLARRLGPNLYECLGRKDQQIKIAGIRVEPAEIEARLHRLEEVQEATVMGIKRESRMVLAAFVQLKGERKERDLQEIKDQLRETLPESMIPTEWKFVESWPRLQNGKKDLIQLKLLCTTEKKEAAIPPKTPLEIELARRWAVCLGVKVEFVSMDDSFFQVGGDSLLAIKFIAELREAYKVDYSPMSFLMDPVLRKVAIELSALLAKSQQIQSDSAIKKELQLLSRPEGLSRMKLTPSQLRMWLHWKMFPETPVYHMYQALHVSGDLDIGCLENAALLVCGRHDAMRTSFLAENIEPEQVIHDEVNIKVRMVDFSGQSFDLRRELAQKAAETEIDNPFDLAKAPLLRILAIKIDARSYYLVMTQHHIITDGWSKNLFISELLTSYNALVNGKEPSLGSAYQFGDYAYNELQKSGKRKDSADFWLSRLHKPLPVTRLPFDYKEPSSTQFQGSWKAIKIPEFEAASFEQLAEKYGVTTFSLYLATYFVFLQKICEQTEHIVGIPVANRNSLELETALGCFVNTIPIRYRVEKDITFEQLLMGLKEETIRALQHSEYPLEDIVDDLSLGRDMGRQPIFQTMFSMENLPVSLQFEDIRLQDLTVSRVELLGSTAKFDLTLFLIKTGGDLIAEFEYSTELFGERTIDTFLETYRNLISELARSPGASIRGLKFAENRKNVGDIRRSLKPEPIAQRIKRFAQQQPGRTAISFKGEKCDYRQLYASIVALCEVLGDRGVKQGTNVILHSEDRRQIALMMLACSASGASFTVMNPELPTSFKKNILSQQNGKSVVFSDRALDDFHVVYHEFPPINFAADSTISQAGLETDIDDGLPAYTIFTSGTQGDPKGVMVSRESLFRHNLESGKAMHLSESTRCVSLNHPSFDVFIEEVFSSLYHGSALYLLEKEEALDFAGMARLMGRESITHLNMPSSLWHAWVDWMKEENISDLGKLEVVVIGSEPVFPDYVADWFSLSVSSVKLLNAYGLSEDCITSTIKELSLDSLKAASIPAGKPIGDRNIYIVDSDHRALMDGLHGEISISGAGLAYGYLGNPRKTAERFIPGPYGTPGARMFLTGDSGRINQYGDLEINGRMDDQIKIRGHRIELSGCEALISKVPGVLESAVLAVELGGSKELIAFIVETEESMSLEKKIEARLRLDLPKYMVPARIEKMERLPRLANHKVDRNALEVYAEKLLRDAEVGGSVKQAGREPENDLEAALLEIIRDLLKNSSIGTDADFFEAGGNSMQAIRYKHKIESVLEAECPLAWIFSYATVEQLSDHILSEIMD